LSHAADEFPQGQTKPTTAALNDYDATVASNMAIMPTTAGRSAYFPRIPRI
jgi:hypothetical protein